MIHSYSDNLSIKHAQNSGNIELNGEPAISAFTYAVENGTVKRRIYRLT